MTGRTKSFATTHDVARFAGVSQSAVSRAFTVGASISPELRDRIVLAAAELGYRPNLLARSLTQRSSSIVGLVTGNMENPFFAAAMEQLMTALEAAGCRVLLFHAEPNAQADHQVDELLSYRVKALILLAVNLSSKLADECALAGIPVILFNRTVGGESGVLSVVGDNEGGARAIASHLLRSGRRRLAFMAGYADSSTSNSREAAFDAFLSEVGAPRPRRVVGHYQRAGAIAATRELLGGAHEPPDAIFCANDLMAIAAVETAREEFGLEPGKGIAIAGFDDIAMAAWPSFSLTTYSQPIDEMVAHAIRFVLSDDRGAPERIIIPGRLIVRNTA